MRWILQSKIKARIRSLFLFFAALAPALLVACTQNGDPPKNILLIVADTLRADHLGCYGFDRPTSARIDRLAEQGSQFNQCYTVVPSTLASFTAILTSMHPKDHGAYRNGRKADETVPVLGEVFQEAGFDTAAFISSYCLSADFGMDRGFDLFDERYTRKTALPDNKTVRSAKDVTDAFLHWFEGREKDRPYFAMVHYFDPHWPYDPPVHIMRRFGAVKKATPLKKPSILLAQENLRASDGKPGNFEMNLHRLYCAEIRYMDRQIGRILDRLEETGALKKTLIVFTADHGETFWEHDDYWNHGLFVYDTTILVPLIFHCPGFVPAGASSDVLLSTLDLAPTLCALAGVRPPGTFQGLSFAERLLQEEQGNERPRPIFAEATMPWSAEDGAPRPNFMKAKCVRSGPWKYIDFPYFKDVRRELYNLEEDPLERLNRAEDPQGVEVARKLSDLLGNWAKHHRNPTRDSAPLDEEAAEKLEGLGYATGKR